ncbi:MAG: pyridoxamine 5'-phosphate oxidase family protein [Acidimicrobiia bacterium]|nr:pyridoxamine 5'-phosphate oxidase family protein [Acidimicrobiia bacterium]
MGTVHAEIDASLAAWLAAQPLFFVATAPRDGGHVNVSPKGLDGTFVVLGPHAVAYLDLTGSGVETISHVRENGRITLMFCSFGDKPRVVRLHGRGHVHMPGDDGFTDLRARFGDYPAVRAVIGVDVERVSSSCGFGVPQMDVVAERDTLTRYWDRKGPDAVPTYWDEKNSTSIDGLPGLPATPDVGTQNAPTR